MTFLNFLAIDYSYDINQMSVIDIKFCMTKINASRKFICILII